MRRGFTTCDVETWTKEERVSTGNDVTSFASRGESQDHPSYLSSRASGRAGKHTFWNKARESNANYYMSASYV